LSKVTHVLMVTVGFESKFQIKSLIELARWLDLFVAIVPRQREEKVDKALEEIGRFCREFIGREMTVVEADLANPHAAFQTVRKHLRALSPLELRLDLSGGMRALALIVLAAVMGTLSPYQWRLLVWTEDLNLRLDLTDLFHIRLLPSPTPLEQEILAKLGERSALSLQELVEELNRPKSTVHKALRRLEAVQMVAGERVGRKLLYRLGEKGKAWLSLRG